MKELHVKSLLPVRLDKYLMDQFPALGMGRLNNEAFTLKVNDLEVPINTTAAKGVCTFGPTEVLGYAVTGQVTSYNPLSPVRVPPVTMASDATAAFSPVTGAATVTVAVLYAGCLSETM